MDDTLGIYVGATSIVASAKRGPDTSVIAWMEITPGDDVFGALAAVVAQADPQLARAPISVVIAVPGHTPHSTRVGLLESVTELDLASVRIVSSASAAVAACTTYSHDQVNLLIWDLHPGLLSLSLMRRYRNTIVLDGIHYDHDDLWRFETGQPGASATPDRHMTAAEELADTAFASLSLKPELVPTWSSRKEKLTFVIDQEATDRDLAELFPADSSAPTILTAADVSHGAARIAATFSVPPTLEVLESLTLHTGLDIAGEYSELFPLNCDLPVSITFEGSRSEANQKSFAFSFLQDTTGNPTPDNTVAHYEFFTPQAGPEGSLALASEITVTEDGLIHMSSRDAVTDEPLEGLVLDERMVPQVRICEKCGQGSDAESRFCEHCGDVFTSAHVDSPESLPATAAESEAQPQWMRTPIPMPPPKPSASPETVAVDANPLHLLDELHECPFCAETIKRAAIKCRHCGEFLVEVAAPDVEPPLARGSANLPPAIPDDDSQDQALREPEPQFSLFVSHASADNVAALEITQSLGNHGIQTWLATRDIQVGDNYAAQIYEAIAASTHLLVLLSPASVASNHVKREVNLAIDKDIAVLPLIVSANADFMRDLPADWKYWLGVVQALPYAGADAAATLITRRLGILP